MISMACALTGTRNEQVALTDVEVRATLRDLLCEVGVTQVYRNEEQVAIEAVYTFPLPLDAVLLDLEVTLGSRTLHGTVVEKASAEAQYERALEQGNSAVMLQQLEPGLWTMNVGNLLPGESARITVRYALLHRWDGERLRLLFPTTVAPRYGASPHAPHQVPEQSLTVENHFSFEMEIHGALREAQFSSPSHAIGMQRDGDHATLSIRQARAVMDRDVIVQLRAPQAPRSFALGDADGDGTAVVAAFHPFFPGLRQPQPLALAIVVDCSGSMQGDSMALARRALGDAVRALRPDDRVGIVAFGNEARCMERRLIACSPDGVGRAREFVGALDADMGGTEIGNALRAAYRLLGEERRGDVFLITDGEVSDWQEVVQEAKRSGHRLFTVGVGSAVSEGFVRELASVTGGACELVAPREGMSERIVRHFERMRAPRARQVHVRWPDGARGVAPARLDAVYEGDTVVASARFDGPATGSVVLEVETEGGEVGRSEVAIVPVASHDGGAARAADGATAGAAAGASRPSTVARLAASMRLAALAEADARQLAVRYQLASPYTHWLVIAERAEGEKGSELPALRKVPQTLAAGWGGTGSVTASYMAAPMMARMSGAPRHAAPAVPMESLGFDVAGSSPSARDDVSFYRRISTPPHPAEPAGAMFRRERGGADRLVTLANDDPSRISLGGAESLLEEAGSGDALAELREAAARAGIDAAVVAPLLLTRELSGRRRKQLTASAAQALDELLQAVTAFRNQLRDAESRGRELHSALQSLAHDPLLDHAAWRQVMREVGDRVSALRHALARLLE